MLGDVYVLAAGVKTPELAAQAGVPCPVYPLKGYLVTVWPQHGVPMVTRNIYSPRHGLLSPLSPDMLRLSGGVEAVGYDASRDESKARALVDRFLGVLKEDTVDTGNISHHACLRPVCGDHVPIIGQTRVAQSQSK